MGYYLPTMAPDKAYISNNLALPKSGINTSIVKAALTFDTGKEEDIIDEDMGVVIGTRRKELTLWDETRTHLIVPRHFLAENTYKDFDFEFEDIRPTEFPHADINDVITLRDDEQRLAFTDLQDNYRGTLNLSCGKGKTIVALKYMSWLKQPALIVVSTSALLEQWRNEIQEFLGIDDVGVIQGKTNQWKGRRVVIAMVQTLSSNKHKWSQEFRRRFGVVVYDEGHHMSAPIFSESADLFYGKRFSLTATATRTDGLQAIYQYHLGGIIHTNLSQELIPQTFFHRLKWDVPKEDEYLLSDVNNQRHLSKIKSYLGTVDKRNSSIVRDIARDMEEDRNILVLTHSVAHADLMGEILSNVFPSTGVITGKVKEARIPILKRSNPVVGTFPLAREGLNKPKLDTLYILTPFSNSNDLQQAWGRIQRIYADKKTPRVRVYIDDNIKQTGSSMDALKQHLRKMGYPSQDLRIVL